MAKILGFKATVLAVKYNSFENKSKFNNEGDTIYICNAHIKEVGQGLAKANFCHNVSLQMSKDDWDNKILEKFDRIEIKDNATWHPDKPVEYTTRTKDKLKSADKSSLQKENGWTISQNKAYPYSIRCKQDQWLLVSKYYDQNYCTIKDTRIKLPLADNKQFKKNSTLDFFLDPPEMTIIAPLNSENVSVIAYSNKNKNGEKLMNVHTEIKEDDGTNYLLLTEVNE